MALTRLRTNQYSDAFSPTTAASLDANGNVIAGSSNIGSGITGQKIEYYTITGDKWAPNITAYSNLTIAGTLTVLGDVQSIEAQQTRVTDSIIGLAYGANTAGNTVTNTLYTYTSSGDDTVPDGEVIGTSVNNDLSVNGQYNGVNVSVTTSSVITSYQNDTDVGFIGMKDPLNFAAVYSASADSFVVGFTPDNELVSSISFTSYANLRANVGTFDALGLGNIVIANNTISTDGTSSIIIRPNASDADSNIYLYAGNVVGNSLITTTGDVSANNVTASSEITATGNISGDNLVSANDVTTATVTASGNVSGDNLISTNDVTTATVTASGNVSGDNLISANDVTTATVTASGNISGDNLVSANDVTTATVTASGNISGDNIFASTDVIATGDVSGTNFTASGDVTATGNVDGSNGNFTGDVFATNISITGTFTAAELTATGNVTGNNVVSTNDVTTATVTASGNISGDNLISANDVTTATVTASGNISGDNLVSANDVTTATVTASGNISGDNLVSANDVTTATVTASGNISGDNLISANDVTTATVTATGNISGDNLVSANDVTTATVTASGNVSGDNLISANDVTTVTVTASGNVNVTANVNAGNVTATGTVEAPTGIFQDLTIDNDLTVAGNLRVDGNLTYLSVETVRTEDTIIDLNTAADGVVDSNIATGVDSGIRSYYDDDISSFFGRIDSSGEFRYYSDVNSAASSTTIDGTLGNIRAANFVSEGDVTTATVTASGNISGDNLISANDVTTATVTASGNISGDNLVSANDVTTATVTASGNISGDNLVSANDVTTATVTASGNISGDNLVSANDVTTATVTASGNISGDNLVSANDVTTATVTASGNISGDNLISANDVTTVTVTASGDITATGNVTGGNLITGGVVEATGNVIGGNLVTTGDVSGATLTISGNLSGDNVLAANDVIATGNVSGANITTTGVVEATGNVIGGNLVTTGDATVTGNVDVTGNINGTGAVFSSNVVADKFIGNIDAGGANTHVQFNDDDALAGSADFTFDKDTLLLTVTGNISGGNLTTAGVVDATGNVSGGNITTDGVVEATGNIIGGNLVTTGVTSTGDVEATGTANLGNISISGDTITNNETSNDVQINPASSGNVVINSGLDSDARFSVYGGDQNLLVASDTQVAIWSNAYVDSDGTTIDFAFTPNITLDIQSNLSMRVPTGNTAQRPGNPTPGMFRYNTTDAIIEWYDGSNWSQARGGGQAVEYYAFTGNGATAFDIPNSEADTQLVFVAINGVIQQPGVSYAYTVTSDPNAGTSTITFTEAPTAQDTIDIRVIGTVDTLNGFSYGNASFVVSGTDNWSVTGDLIPSANVTYNLGSDTNRWANLHLAGNTIYLGGARIEFDGTDFALKTSGGSTATLTANVSGSAEFDGITKSGTDSVGNIGQSDNAFNTTFTDIVSVESIAKRGSNGTGNIGQTDNRFNTVFAQATSALYADLAENYKGDKSYAPGTVVMFGGDAEVTQCNEEGCRRVAGVVSTAPAYLMNDNGEENMVPVALMGRVPTQVRGPVRKGDMMISAGDGKAMASELPSIGSVIGKALENFDGEVGIIEVVIGKL